MGPDPPAIFKSALDLNKIEFWVIVKIGGEEGEQGSASNYRLSRVIKILPAFFKQPNMDDQKMSTNSSSNKAFCLPENIQQFLVDYHQRKTFFDKALEQSEDMLSINSEPNTDKKKEAQVLKLTLSTDEYMIHVSEKLEILVKRLSGIVESYDGLQKTLQNQLSKVTMDKFD